MRNTKKWFWFLLAFVAVINIVWWFSLQFSTAHNTVWNYLFNFVYGVPFVLTALYAGIRIKQWKKMERSDRAGVLYITAGVAAHGFAQFAWTYYNLVLHIDAPESSLADVFYTAAVLLQAAGFLMLLLHGRTKKLNIREFVFSHLTLFFSILVASYLLVIGLPTEGSFITLYSFYSAMSFLRAMLILLNVFRNKHSDLRPFFFAFLLAAVFLAGADTFYAIRDYTGSYWNGDVADGLFMLGALMSLFAGAILPRKIKHNNNKKDSGMLSAYKSVIFSVSILLFGIIIAAIVSQWHYVSLIDEYTATKEAQTTKDLAFVKDRFSLHETASNALVAYFIASEFVTEDEFHAFIARAYRNIPPDIQMFFLDENRNIKYNTLFSDIDFLSSPELYKTIHDAQITPNLIASPPFTIKDDISAIILVQLTDNEIKKNRESVVTLINLPKFFARLPWYQEDASSTEITIGNIVLSPQGDIKKESVLADDNEGIKTSISGKIYGNDWTVTTKASETDLQDLITSTWLWFIMTALTVSAVAALAYVLLSQHENLQSELDDRTESLRRFVSLVSHQLRTPMTQLRWSIEAMLNMHHLPRDAKELLRSMNAAIIGETKLVEDLLNVSRIERGVFKVNLTSVSAEEIINLTTKPLDALRKEKNSIIDISYPDKKLNTYVDKEKLIEALRNLADNAIRYCPNGSLIKISAIPSKNNSVSFEIKDNGPGIPASVQRELFDVKTKLHGGAGSTGLGMYLAKRFIEAMQGTIDYETSKKGTSFTIKVPSSKKSLEK